MGADIDRIVAIDGVLEVLGEWTMMPFPSITCSEAERLAAFARAFGDEELAGRVLYAHSEEDDEGDAHYRMEEPDHG